MNENCLAVNEQLLKLMSVKELAFLYSRQVNSNLLHNINYSYNDCGYNDCGYNDCGYNDCGSWDSDN